MKTQDLQQPIWLLYDDLKKKQKVSYMHYIEATTKLALKEKPLVGCFLIDGSDHVYQITDIIDLGNLNKPWKFEFFNPMRKIDLILEEVSSPEILQKISSLMKTRNED